MCFEVSESAIVSFPNILIKTSQIMILKLYAMGFWVFFAYTMQGMDFVIISIKGVKVIK